jgi:mono/diheme cytochrome c family protein
MFPAVIATVVFILAFVLIALAVFFLAMGGGPRGARKSLQSQSKGGSRAISIGLTVLMIGFGLAVPAVVIAYNTNTQSHDGTGGLKLTASQENGREVFAHNCAQCHTLAAANAVGKVGPNLDVLRPPRALVLNAINLGRAQGNGSMPQQLVSGEDEQDVADFVAAAAGRG